MNQIIDAPLAPQTPTFRHHHREIVRAYRYALDRLASNPGNPMASMITQLAHFYEHEAMAALGLYGMAPPLPNATQRVEDAAQAIVGQMRSVFLDDPDDQADHRNVVAQMPRPYRADGAHGPNGRVLVNWHSRSDGGYWSGQVAGSAHLQPAGWTARPSHGLHR